jgi:uncharacterized repeat protein (TIGR01451 family)
VITETIPAATLLAGVSTLPSAGLLVSSNLAAGTATVTVVAGGQTIVTFIDAAIPIDPTNGFVQICKVAGAGVAAGTNFAFNVAGTPVTVPAGPAPGGSCGTPVTVPAGTATITETILAATLLAGVSTLPSAGLLVSSDLAAGTATVTVLAGGQTIVTFIDAAIPATTGFVQVCKVAGLGVAVGTNFTFTVAGTPVTVPAGAAPGGSCSAPVTVPTGAAVITETVPAGTALTGVSTLPSAGLLISSNLGAGSASVTVTVGGQTIVTFINQTVLTPPSVSKSFGSRSVLGGGTSRLTITLSNPNSTAITGVSFTDTYPGGLVNSAAPSPATTCGGTATALPGGGSLVLAGGTIPALGSCMVTVNVTSAGIGNIVNTIPAGGITTANAGTNAAAASATLIVVKTNVPTLSAWAMLVLAGLIAFSGIRVLRKRLEDTHSLRG